MDIIDIVWILIGIFITATLVQDMIEMTMKERMWFIIKFLLICIIVTVIIKLINAF